MRELSPRPNRSRWLAALALSTLGLWIARDAGAATEYPTRPIRAVVPAAAGGITDVAVRALGGRMRDTLRQTVVVDNRGGAGGLIGGEIVKNAGPDGYTLLYGHAAMLTFLPALKRNMPYQVMEDFAPIALCVRTPFAVVVRADAPFTMVRQMIDAARSRPKGITYGTAGVGNGSHLLGLMLAREAGGKMLAIHFKGDGPALVDLLAGQVDFYTAGNVRHYVDAGRLRVLAVTGANRWFVFPGAPTLAEAGLKGVELYGFSGFLGPKGTPSAVVNRVNASANQALKDPKVRETLTAAGYEMIGGSPAEFRAFMQREIDRVRKVGADNNLVID
ncbi:MAG: tripartite tricarboxylate transporter substrate binding protein [Burkholderiales bacterium]|nr:tripartite tricarboxylate transporter substrate binding protein [Burkholderiales bacterium]